MAEGYWCEEGELNGYVSPGDAANDSETQDFGNHTENDSHSFEATRATRVAAPQYLFDEDGKKTEIRAVPGYPGYFVTEDGEVYSKIHSAKAWGRRMSPVADKDGYLRIEVSVDGTRRKVSVHRFVALAFLGPQPADMPEIRHDDGSPSNNHYKNLFWSDRLDNMADRRRHGRNPVGSRNGRAILNEEQVRVIKVRLANGEPRAAIAADHKVSQAVINDIATGRNWSHVA